METVIIIEIVILVLMVVVTLTTNIVTLLVIACTDYLRNINRVYLYSMTISDLCVGVFIFPFALYSAVIDLLGEPEINPKLCHIQAYLTVVLFLSGLYAIAWLNVDHYVAVRKPERYKVMMSPPRSLCWMAFGWIAAISFCCPPVLSYSDIDQYYQQVFMCAVHFGSEIPYFISAAVLALIPAFLVLIITNVYLFTHGFRKKQKMYESVLLDVSSRPRNYQINFIISTIYAGTWLPWCIIRIIGYFVYIPDIIHFITFWTAMGNSFYKYFVYATMSKEYRRGLQELFRMCCSNCRHGCRRQQQQGARSSTASAATATKIVTKPSTSGPPPVNV